MLPTDIDLPVSTGGYLVREVCAPIEQRSDSKECKSGFLLQLLQGQCPSGGFAPGWNARFGGIVQRTVATGDNAKSAPFGQQCSGQSVTGDHQHHALDD